MKEIVKHNSSILNDKTRRGPPPSDTKQKPGHKLKASVKNLGSQPFSDE